MQKHQVWPQTWSFLSKVHSTSKVGQEIFNREHYWVQGGLQQSYSSPSCLCCQVHAVPAEVPPTAAGSHSGWLAEQGLAPEDKFKGSDLLSGGRCSLLCRINLRVTNSNYLFFWWTEGSESACSDGSKEKPGISKTCSRKGNFSLALSTGQHAKIVTASERAWFPHKFSSPENMEMLPFSQGSSGDKFLSCIACWSSRLPSLSRWMRFCWRNTSLLTSVMPSFLHTKIAWVASQVKQSQFPAPAVLEEILQGKKKGQHMLKPFLPYLECAHAWYLFLHMQIFRQTGATGW